MSSDPLQIRVAEFRSRDQSCEALAPEAAAEMIRQAQGPLWADIVSTDARGVFDFLHGRLGYHELAVEDALSSEERPAVQEFGEVLFFVLPVILPGNDEDDFAELAFFLTRNTLVTYCSLKLACVDEWFCKGSSNGVPPEVMPARTAHRIADSIVDAYFPVTDAIEDLIDEIADQVSAGDDRQVKDIQRVRRRLLQIRRRLSPTRDVLNSLLRRDTPNVPPAMVPYFQDVLDHVLRLSDLIDMNRDTLASLLDVHLASVSNKINEVMKRMTFFGTALMTSTLIAGIYGMNFKYMPELHWLYGYPFSILLMFGAFLGVYKYFRYQHWL